MREIIYDFGDPELIELLNQVEGDIDVFREKLKERKSR
jgi:hypothetical protein